MSQSAFPFPQPLSERFAPQTVSEFVGLDKPKKIMAKFAEAPTLERINNEGNYEPGNCKWATRLEQVINRRPYRR